MPKLKLNDDLVADMPYRKDSRRIKDSVIPRLYLTVSKNSKTWTHVERVDGRNKRFTLGKFPAMSTEEARAASMRFSPEKAQDIKRENMTVAQVFEIYVNRQAVKTKSHEEIKSYYKRFAAKKLSSVLVPAFTRIVAEDWFNAISERNGDVTANRALQYLKAAFNYCLQRDIVDKNPCMGVKPNKEESRKRFMSAKEMKSFMDNLKVVDPIHQCIFKVLLFTGQRKSQVLSMRWEDVDMAERLWYAEVKGGRQVTVPLCDKVMDLLRERLDQRIPGKSFVFYQHGNKDSHVKNLEVPWNKLRRATGLHDLRIHDLRRTLASWQVINGESMRVVQATLTHESQSSTMVYAHLNQEVVRDSVDRTVSKMLST